MSVDEISCRANCGACCIAPSISSPIPGMPGGKPAGVRCIHLTADMHCAIFDRDDRPAVCNSLRPTREMCGANARDAYVTLARLERMTRVQ